MNKSLAKLIDTANDYIRFAQENHVWGIGHFGSTWPVLIEYTHPIRVSPKGNIVTVQYLDHARGSHPDIRVKRKYDTRLKDSYDFDGVRDLRHDLQTYVIKAIKNGARQDGVQLP